MRYPVVDCHCDALLKLWEQPYRNFRNSEEIDSNYERLVEGHVKLQFFAIFVEPWIKQEQKFQVVIEQIDHFYKSVLVQPKIRHIKNWEDINSLQEGEIGAVLALEGVDAIGDDITKLSLLRHLGVLSVGLTWNQANLVADGVDEDRGAGLTNFGREVVQFLNEHKLLTDVSHISVNGFWDVMELAHKPLASHSNAKALCSHQRNLNDDQIRALVKKEGFIGLVFHPLFLMNDGKATIEHIVDHIDHFCALGARNYIGFGSDFDGISSYVEHLRHSGHFVYLGEQLEKHYSSSFVKQLMYENAFAFFNR
ncbi:dipeptidase [Bacillus sp. JCM 19034]|uniref:dipeptidase n=1 Tax=Bacillus sp. JCM 19034 TaxID=1481928 RepID=UPI000781CC22|nr:dipeptidase [Bacillus sp. JCM 19034]